MSGGEESDHVRLPLQSNPGEDLTPQLHDYIQVCWMTLVCLSKGITDLLLPQTSIG